ncbi:MAG TPA: M48 family metallopeptidase [Gammaproteobacteria bacterium]|jgi:predicted Zn-dependent protease|nr:M48 family metallopeptidase [Gammaproteobacteria bacterium]MBT6651564.1 M48 family metallopeptidase [Gammaproteobacteria bacterium]MBT7327197.1 M48 family metallopeptidase [Gammaproteobacteria bacterium]HIJ23857.1 M48 family metallopeptidase [Gammaproteobacteria bacterium]HIJ32776.1 M48 family metallopeptidase [Gammaproteobacteria bacterium]
MSRYLYYIRATKASFQTIFSLFLLLFVSVSLPLSASEIRLPSLGGDSSSALMTPQQEQLLGEAFLRSLREQADFLLQPEVNHYIQSLGRSLVLQSETPTAPFEFFIINDDSINAFAGPGGKIGIHTGLILKSESEGELAAVLAHEIAHVSQRHLLRALESRQNLSLQTAATILTAILASSASPQAGEAVIATATGLSLQKQINFTRSNEQEADRIGMQILHSNGYPAAAMPAFFKRLQLSTRHEGETIPEYLRTHPLTLSRIADAESRIAHYPELPPFSNDEFQRIRNLLHVQQFTNPEAAVRYYKAQLSEISDSTNRSGLQFGLGYALLQAGQAAQALQQLLPLTAQSPEQPTLLITTAQAEVANNQRPAALKRIATAYNLFPSHLGLSLFYTNLLQQSGALKEALQILQDAIDQRPDNPSLYKTLAANYHLSRQPSESHLALAEYHYLRGETTIAIHQLDYAERTGSNKRNHFILFAKIDEKRRIYEQKEQLEKESKI